MPHELVFFLFVVGTLMVASLWAMRCPASILYAGKIGEPTREVIVKPDREPIPQTVPRPETEPVPVPRVPVRT
jgi:hypothetical protein